MGNEISFRGILRFIVLEIEKELNINDRRYI